MEILQLVIEYAGVLISLLLRYAPFLSDWFAGLSRWYKVGAVAVVILLWAIGSQIGIEGAPQLIDVLDEFIKQLGAATLTHVIAGSKQQA